jgi:hypothetical protein
MHTALIIGVVGLLIWVICSRLERQADASDVFFAAEHKAREEKTRFERASLQREKSSAHQAVRFFRSVGIERTGCRAWATLRSTRVRSMSNSRN